MLITKLKPEETILPLLPEKLFIINCHGCREISFPEAEAAKLEKKLSEKGIVSGSMTSDYICHPENLKLHLEKRKEEIKAAEAVLVFSCGVGMQTVSDLLSGKKVYTACDTYALPGFQGLTPSKADCGQCGECYLNMTGGICPITACSKSLVNGPCGGTKNGFCEVDPAMECGWERIYRRLKETGRLENLKGAVQIRNYASDLAGSKEVNS